MVRLNSTNYDWACQDRVREKGTVAEWAFGAESRQVGLLRERVGAMEALLGLTVDKRQAHYAEARVAR